MKNFLNNTRKYFVRIALVAVLLGILTGNLLNRFIDIAPINHIDPQTLPYTDTFFEHALQYNALDVASLYKFSKLRVNIGKLPWYLFFSKHTIGLCDGNNIQVMLDETFWNEANRLERELLVFHELSHCILDQDHVEGEDHIMNPVILAGVTYSIYYQKLMDKLFVCSKNCPVVKFDGERYK